MIERELFVLQFHGLIVIHAADEIEGLQAAVYGADLHDALASPILSCLRSKQARSDVTRFNSVRLRLFASSLSS
jgi:hypothetical protein